MSLTATYMDDLGRVRLVASYPTGLQDSFNRTTSNGWGVADTGEAWSVSSDTGANVAADFSVTGSHGRISLPATNIRHFAYAGDFTDVDLTATVICPGVAAGAPISAGGVARFGDTQNYYMWQLIFTTTGTVNLALSKRVANVSTTLNQATGVLSPIAGDVLKIRCQAIGTSLQGKVWFSDGTEPSLWTVTATDSDLTQGSIAFQGNRNNGNTNGTVNLDYAILSASDPTSPSNPTFQRSADAAKWQTIRGANPASVVDGTATVDDYEYFDGLTHYRTLGDDGSTVVDTADITVPITAVWLKSIPHAFLNRTVKVVGIGDVTRPSRTGVFPIIGRSYAVAVTDLRTGRQVQITVMADSKTDAETLETILSAGDIMYLQAPSGSAVPTMYAAIGDVGTSRPTATKAYRLLSLPLTEVAAPGLDVVPTTVEWVSVSEGFSSWSALVTEEPTWEALQGTVGRPSDVIVE